MTDLLVRLFIKEQDIKNPKVRQKYGFLSGIVGIICNSILFTLKLMVGIFTVSIAVLADAFNNLSDAGASLITLIGFKMAARPADKEHPFGHGRIEYICGLIVSILIVVMGLEFVKSSIEKIINPEDIKINIISVIILVVSILIKLWMALFNKKLDKKISSYTMKATAMDSLSDVIATSTVLLSMIFTYFTGIVIDGYTGMIVAMFIIYTGLKTAKETLNPLLGQVPDKNFVEDIKKKVLSYEGVVGAHDIIVHNYGPGTTIISLHAEISSSINVMDIHEIIDEIERAIKDEFDCEAIIHMDPVKINDKKLNSMRDKVDKIVKEIDESLEIHDFRMLDKEDHVNLIFDIIIPLDIKLDVDEILNEITNKIKSINASYETIINVDRR